MQHRKLQQQQRHRFNSTNEQMNGWTNVFNCKYKLVTYMV